MTMSSAEQRRVAWRTLPVYRDPNDPIDRAERAERERNEARAESGRIYAQFAQLRQDRADALSVTSRDGLLSSEWVARVGKAERERDEARAELAVIKAAIQSALDNNGGPVDSAHPADGIDYALVRLTDFEALSASVAKGAR